VVDHAVEQLVLARDVVVKRCRLDVELLRQLPHAELSDAALVGQRNGGREHALSAQAPGGR
jgi:hypothetical protein